MSREVWDDGTWFEGYEERAEPRPPVPGITVPVEPGIHTEVTLPDGTIHHLASPITIAGAGGSIFIPVTVSWDCREREAADEAEGNPGRAEA